MNEVAERRGGTAVANPDQNYYTQYGDQVAQRSIVGKLLKFSKGDYFAGADNEVVPQGTRFIARMDELLVGWIRWEDNRPTDQVMGRLGSGYQPKRRNELGDNDKSQWEIDETSKEPRDPWQFSNYLLLKQVDEKNELLPPDAYEDENGGIFTFTTASTGGIGALGLLAQKFGRLMRQHPDEWPVAQISVGGYWHKIKSRGYIKVPVFKLVGWVPKERFSLDEIDAEIPADANVDEPAKLPLTGGTSGATKTRF